MSTPRRRGIDYEQVGSDYLEKRSLQQGQVGWVLLAGLGVAYVISGDFAGWNFGLAEGGWGGLLIATILMAVMYTCMVLGLAELSSALPVAGAGYGFARRALGPLGGFATGTAILIEYAVAPAAIVIFIGGYVEALGLFGLTNSWPVYLVAYAIFVGFHLRGVGEALKVMFAITAVAVVGLVVFSVAMIPNFDVDKLFDIVPTDAAGASDFIPFGYAGVLRRWCTDLVLPGDRGRPACCRGGARPAQDMPKGIITAMLVLLVFAALMLLLAPGGAGSSLMSESVNPLPEALREAYGPGSFAADVVNYIGLAGWSPASSRSSSPTHASCSRSPGRATCRASCPPPASGHTPWVALIVPGTIGFLLAAASQPSWDPQCG
jgi:ethanolamine permease